MVKAPVGKTIEKILKNGQVFVKFVNFLPSKFYDKRYLVDGQSIYFIVRFKISADGCELATDPLHNAKKMLLAQVSFSTAFSLRKDLSLSLKVIYNFQFS